MIVVDAMILAYALIEVPDQTPAVNRLLDQDLVWGAPALWRSELRNVLLRYVRAVAGDQPGPPLTLDDARRKMQVAETLIGERTFEVDSVSVLEESVSTGFSAYDSEYVVLAKDLEVSLVSTDEEILRGVPDVAVRPENVEE
jgi:predicted nucleic acid-binding protein